MLHRKERILDNIPVGSLGIIAVDGCQEMGARVNDYLVRWRKEDESANKNQSYASRRSIPESKAYNRCCRWKSPQIECYYAFPL